MSHACLWMQNEPYVSVDVYMHQSCRHEPCMSVDAELAIRVCGCVYASVVQT